MIEVSGQRDFSLNSGALIFQKESVHSYPLTLRFSGGLESRGEQSLLQHQKSIDYL